MRSATIVCPLTNEQLRCAPVPVSLASGSISIPDVAVSFPQSLAVTGNFYQTTQPVSGTVAANINGTVPVSIASMPLTAITGTVGIGGTVSVAGAFFQATQPVSIASMPSTPVTGAFFQVTQPVSIASMPSTPVTGTFWQTTQPVSGTVTITPPALTKGAQSAAGLSVQELKDAGRSALCMTAEFAFAQVAETLLTMTLSADGATATTFSSRVITSGKKLRIQSISMEVESLGSGTAPQRAYLRLRRNTAGATIASSPLQGVWACANSTAIVKSAAFTNYQVPDALEMTGDGTGTFGFTLETPDWVATTATGRAKITVIGYEF